MREGEIVEEGKDRAGERERERWFNRVKRKRESERWLKKGKRGRERWRGERESERDG